MCLKSQKLYKLNLFMFEWKTKTERLMSQGSAVPKHNSKDWLYPEIILAPYKHSSTNGWLLQRHTRIYIHVQYYAANIQQYLTEFAFIFLGRPDGDNFPLVTSNYYTFDPSKTQVWHLSSTLCPTVTLFKQVCCHLLNEGKEAPNQ